MILLAAASLRAEPRPNILWLVAEDINPRYFGAYGDRLADTPTVDRLARENTRFTSCHSTAPVCAPARFCLITGRYAASFGPAQHMRAVAALPPGVRTFPSILREAGYFTSNNAKMDYNARVDLADTWDQNGATAHWRQRKSGQPFFSVFNFNGTHESANWPEGGDVSDELRKKASLPRWAPDNTEARAQLANNYLIARKYDDWIKERLAELAADGLTESTIVFLYGDNGGTFLRTKRFLYDEGTHVPLVIVIPALWREHARVEPGVVAELVSFVDFAPTVLSLAGVTIPAGLPGRSIAGPERRGAPEFVFAHRDRMGEGHDIARAVKDARWCYIRNYLPWQPHGEVMGQYAFRSPAYRAWQRAYSENALTEVQSAFWRAKSPEELHDLQTDPEQIDNLAGNPAHRDRLLRMRAALRAHILATHDNGFMPEGAPCEGFVGSRQPGAYPLAELVTVAETVSSATRADVPQLLRWLSHAEGSTRWWAAKGLAGLRETSAREELLRHLDDPWPTVQIAVAEALAAAGDSKPAIATLLPILRDSRSGAVLLQAASALVRIKGDLGPDAREILQAARQTTVSREIAENLHQVLQRLETRIPPNKS